MKRYEIRGPMIIHETLDGEAVLVNLETGSYYSTAGVGARIWGHVEHGSSTARVMEDLRRTYQGIPDDLDDSVRHFLDELVEEGLAIVLDNGSGELDVAFEPPPQRLATFNPPLLEKFTDMQELILLDPVHDVEEERGWPRTKSTD